MTGYAARRNEVWPPERRGASRLSPYIRHGLIDLPRRGTRSPTPRPATCGRFRDELLWQEYARHLYARLGARLGRAAPGGGAGAATPAGRGSRGTAGWPASI